MKVAVYTEDIREKVASLVLRPTPHVVGSVGNFYCCALIGVQIKQPNFRTDFGTVVANLIMRWMTGRHSNVSSG